MTAIAPPWGHFGYRYPEHQLGALVREHARRRGDEPAVISPQGQLSWAELDRRADRLAAKLIASGFEPGDRIGWLGKNGLDFPVVLLGVRRAGLVLLGLNWRLSEGELGTIMDRASPALIFGDDEFQPLIPGERKFVASGEALMRWIADEEPASPRREDPDELATLFFSSGTTGDPKAIAYTIESVMSLVFAPHTLDFDADSRLLIVAPVFHTAGWVWTHYGLAGGMTQVQLPGAVPADMLDAVERWRVTHAQWVPAMLKTTVDHLDDKPVDLSSLRMIAYGTSPIAESLLLECRERFGCDFSQVYGLTESVGGLTHLPPSAHSSLDRGKSQATGLANPGTDLRIVDAEGGELPPGETGEILARQPFPIGRYWSSDGRLEPIADDEGWLHTGDVGHLDEDGYLTVTDRKKDIIISGGENVFPVEVEHVLVGLPGVAEAAVCGIPHPKWGETVVAAVVPKPGSALETDVLIDRCREKLAHYKCPTRIVEISCLPRNASGKVLRRELPRLFCA